MTTMRPLALHRNSASALLLVIWAIMMLSAAMVAWTYWVHTNLERAGDESRAVEAKAMAHSGLALALHPSVTEKTPGLEEAVNSMMGFRVRIIGEGGKLNINTLLQGEDPVRMEILKRWLELHGLDYQQREVLVDCLIDYTDADNVKRLHGVEDEPGYTPPNRPFNSIEEIAEVANVEPLLRSPGWEDELTIYSDGRIDLSSANEEILRLIPGLSEPRIQTFLQKRRGPDKVDGTKDDFTFKNVKDVWVVLGLTPAQQAEMGKLVTLNDQTKRIISEGQSGNVLRQVEVVAIKGTGKPTIKYWKE